MKNTTYKEIIPSNPIKNLLKSDFNRFVGRVRGLWRFNLDNFARFGRSGGRCIAFAAKRTLIFALIFAWVFSGIIQVYNFPPKPEIAQAAATAIRQEINIVNGAVTASGDDSALVMLDTRRYTSASYYFETVAKVTSGTLTVALERVGTATQDGTISVTATSYTRQRSAFTPPSNATTTYNINLSGGTGPSVQAARIVITQSANPITDTETQIEIGNLETGKSNRTNSALSNPKYWKYDAANWDGTVTASAEVTVKTGELIASSTTWSTAGTYTNGYKVSSTTLYAVIEAWGSGGGGGVVGSSGGAGGGGGAYARSTTTPAVASTHTLVIGAGGTTDSTTRNDSTYDGTTVVADGGAGTGNCTASNQGLASGSTGDVSFNGGNGGICLTTNDTSGGGGGAAGPLGAGETGANAATSANGAGGRGNNTFGGAAGTAGTYNSGVGGNGGTVATGGGGGGGAGGGNCASGCTGGAGGAPGGGGGASELTGGAGAAGQIKITERGGYVGVALEEDDGAFGTWTFKVQIASQFRATSTASTTQSVAFTPTDGRHYRIVASTTQELFTYAIYNAKIIIDQTGTPTKLEPQYLIANTGSFGGSTGLKDYDTLFDPTEWSGVTNTYIHQAEGVSGGTGDVKLQQDPNGTPADISGSTITDVIQLEQSSSMTMPGSSQTLDVNVTGTGTLNASRILVRVTPFVPTVIFSGAAYEDDSGTTALVACDDLTSNIGVVIGTSPVTQVSTTCGNSDGAWTVDSGLTSIAASTSIIAYINGSASTYGATVSLYRGTGDLGKLTIRASTTIADYDTADGPINPGHFNTWDNDDDTDLPYVFTAGQGLTFEQGTKFLIGTSTAAANAVTFMSTSSAASTTPGGTFARGGDVQVTSGSTLDVGSNAFTVGGLLLNFGTYTTTGTTTFNGTSKSFDFGSSNVIGNLELANSSSITASSSFRTSNSGTMYVPSGNTLTLDSGKFASTSVLSVGGTLTMTGNATATASSTITTGGSFNSHLRFDVSTASSTLGAFTTGNSANLEIFSSNASARGLTLTGNQSIAGALLVNAAGAGNLTLESETNDPTVSVTGDIDFIGGGAGSEILSFGSGAWSVAGNADLTGGTIGGNASNVFTMSGTSKTLTSAGNSFEGLTLSGTITLNDNVSAAGNVTLAQGTVSTGRTLTLSGANTTLSLTGGPLTLANLTINSGASTTVATNDLAVSGTLTVTGALEVGSGSIASSTSAGTLTLTGTIHGAGTTTVANSTLGTAGVLNSNVSFDATAGNVTMPTRTYGGNVEAFNSSATARSVTMNSGTHTINGAGGLMLRSTNGGITLDGSTNSSALTLAGNLSCVSGGGTKTFSTGATANTWALSGNLDFTNCAFSAGVGNTVQMSGTSKTLTFGGNNLHHLAISGSGSITTGSGGGGVLNGDLTVNSGTTLTLGNSIAAIGNVTLGGSTVLVDNGYDVILGSSGNFDPGGETIHSLWVQGGYTLINNDLTVSSSTVDSASSLTVGAGRTLTATSTMTLNGSITGAGTTTFGNSSYACSNVPSAGTISTNMRIDATGGNCTIPARVYAANFEAYNNSGLARTITFSSGSSTVVSSLFVNANSGNVVLSGSNNPEMHVDGNLDFLGASTPSITSGTNSWTVKGNVDFTGGTYTAGSGNTLAMAGSSKTLTSNGQTLDNFTVSGGSVSLADLLSVSGNLTISGGTFADLGNVITLSGTSKNIDLSGGSQTLHSVRISGTYTLTGNDLTISTSTIDSSKSLTVGAGRILVATSTLTLNGSITGAGTTTFGNAAYACSNIPSGGTLSTNVTADATAGDCTLPSRTYSANVGVYSNSASAARTVTMAGATAISGNLYLDAANTQNVVLAGPNAAVSVGDIDFVGAGAGNEVLTTGNNTWTVSGSADFTNGGFTPTSGNTWVMSGTSKTLTPVSGFENLTLSGSITLGGNASSTGDVVLSGTVTPGSNSLTLAGVNKTIQGGRNTLYDLTIPANASSTLSTSDLTISNALTVTGAFEIGSGRVATSGTVSLTGTLHGSGTSTVQTSLTASGVLNAHTRFDVTNASSTMPAGTYGGNVEVYNAGATSRGVYIPTGGTATLNSALLLNAAGSGNVMLIGTSSTLTVSGAATYIGNGAGSEMLSAGTLNWTFNSALNTSNGIFSASSATTTIKGDYTNTLGTFISNSGAVDFAGTSQQTITGNATGTSAFYKLAITNTSGSDPVSSPSVIFTDAASTTDVFQLTAPSAKVRLAAGKLYTFQNTNWTNPGAGLATLYSSSAGTQSTIYIPGTQQTVSYIGFKDMTCGPGTTINASNGTNSNVSGNGGCITFALVNASIVSAANQVFEYQQSSTAISQITVTAGNGASAITAGNDLRIAIATSSAASPIDMRWDTSDPTATIGGSQTCTVSSSVSYEGGGSALLIPITGSDCDSGNTIIVSGLSFASFNTVAASTSGLRIYLDGGTDVTANATNTNQYIAIKGKHTLSNHTVGHESNKFAIGADTTVTNADLSSFKLTPAGESITVSQLVFSLSGVSGFATENITNALLYADYNANGEVDGTDESIMGAGNPSISGSTGSITFSTSFSTSTARNYILQASVSSIGGGDELFIDLPAGNITASGATSLQTITPTGNITKIKHHKPSGTQGELDFPPAGRVVVTGGGGGGGSSLGSDPNYSVPSALGSTFSQWTNAANAFASDDASATEATANDKQDYRDFTFNVPAGNTITGIEVKLEASGSTAAGTIGVELSWDGGTSVTSSGKVTNTLSTVDDVYTLGGSTDTWGRTWSSSDFSNANFRVRVNANPSSNTINLDAMQVRVYHSAGGGGGGGGGEVRAPSPWYYASMLQMFENVSTLLTLFR